ncbi:dihydrodipicolinate synthase family protein [Phenylobacterium montanum]|uniref:Dihydrodipicolinate synthase family protein n=1 Tax=Phenylobacterium montanum TaxID=2823693 RepID=A0A975IUY0_9CAUL|nr:dihydrodipicolinate synthase family protein [Caulobacter sp. S6]QUD86731.1 dihydrodipicolinate synthase family protein [Caulobacter sp. S6]
MSLAAGAAAVAALAGAGTAAAARDFGSPVKTLFWTAAITPCDKNLKFDPGAFRDVLAWFKHQGADGIVVLGTSGEYPSFSVAERKLIAETALKDKLGMNIIVGPGTPNFPETLELAQHAQDHGADGLLVIPPFYYPDPPTEGLVRYYSMLFDQVRIPINLYHIPGNSHVKISHDLIRALMHYPNLAGIKDSTGDPAGYAAFVAAFPELNMRSGTGNNLEIALEHGMGAILMEGNVFTKQCADVFTAYRAKQDYKPALARLRAAEASMREAGIYSFGPMKYALSVQMGAPQFYQRPPHADATDQQKTMLRAALDQMKNLA